MGELDAAATVRLPDRSWIEHGPPWKSDNAQPGVAHMRRGAASCVAADDAERLSLTAANALAKWPVVIGARSSGDAPSVSSVCMGMACNGTSYCSVETPVDAVGAAIGDGFLRILCVAAKAG